MTIYLRIEPKPYERPRFAGGHAYNAPKYANYKKECQFLMKDVFKTNPLENPLHVNFEFILPCPKSKLKRPQNADVRPDLDNYIKAVLDAGNGILWRDDSQVISLSAKKKYHYRLGEHAGIIISMEAITYLL